MNIRNIIIVMILAVMVSCSNDGEKKTEKKTWEHEVTVKEVIQTSAYTYLLVNENGAEQWIAVAKMDANVNDVYFYNTGLEMPNFKSKELDRTFDKLLLVQVISDGKGETPNRVAPKAKAMKQEMTEHKHEGHSAASHEKSIGNVTLKDLFANPGEYSGKKITVRGKVVKYNPSIMGKNWFHIVDASGEHDLTITTNAVVKIDDEVTYDGVIATNKDFGAGYKYDIIMEEGVAK